MTNTPTNGQPEQTVAEIFSKLNGSGAHACYCERSTDGGCTCALKDEYLALSKAALNRQALATALRLIGDAEDDEDADGELIRDAVMRNRLRAELRQAFTDYYGINDEEEK